MVRRSSIYENQILCKQTYRVCKIILNKLHFVSQKLENRSQDESCLIRLNGHNLVTRGKLGFQRVITTLMTQREQVSYTMSPEATSVYSSHPYSSKDQEVPESRLEVTTTPVPFPGDVSPLQLRSQSTPAVCCMIEGGWTFGTTHTRVYTAFSCPFSIRPVRFATTM